MEPEELRPIVSAWGGVEKFARMINVSNRLVSYWLAGKRKITGETENLIRSLKPKDKP